MRRGSLTSGIAPSLYTGSRYDPSGAPRAPLSLPRIWQGTQETSGALLHGDAPILVFLLWKQPGHGGRCSYSRHSVAHKLIQSEGPNALN
jgi:hypothetical protein